MWGCRACGEEKEKGMGRGKKERLVAWLTHVNTPSWHTIASGDKTHVTKIIAHRFITSLMIALCIFFLYLVNDQTLIYLAWCPHTIMVKSTTCGKWIVQQCLTQSAVLLLASWFSSSWMVTWHRFRGQSIVQKTSVSPVSACCYILKCWTCLTGTLDSLQNGETTSTFKYTVLSQKKWHNWAMQKEFTLDRG